MAIETPHPLEEIRAIERYYHPNDRVLASIARVAMAPLIGISGAGKSTIIDNVLEADSDHFHFVRTRTTRERKSHETEDSMVFLGSEPSDLAELHDEISSGDYVQFKIHEGTGQFYGTKAEDYAPGKINLLPTLSSAIEDIEQTGFQSVRPTVIVPDISQWRNYFTAQPYSPKDKLGRLEEADESLDYSLRHHSKLYWSHNEQGQQPAVTEDLINIYLQPDKKRNDTETIALAVRLREAGVEPLLRDAMLNQESEAS